MDENILDELNKIDDLNQIPRLERLRTLHFSKKPEICLELPRHITFYRKSWDNCKDSPELRAGKINKYVLELKKPLFPDENLLAGTTTSKPIGVLLYPDFLALAIWPELETISQRPKNRFRITRGEIDELNYKIFPFWIGKTVQEVTRKENPHSQSLAIMERIIFFLTSKVYCISHTVPNYGIVVERGLSDLIKEAREKELSDGTEKDFYKAVQLSLKGIITYARHLASEAERLASQTDDPKRLHELLDMSEVCKRVPAEKPRTFREALNAVWICKVALHQENANGAMSLGRLDQILYPFYCWDRKQGMTLEEAVELVGCFWLKMADHAPLMTQAGEEVFGGTGSNQAITLGGVDMKGKDAVDAVNELTHIMLKVTELLMLRDPNVNARYYPGVNDKKYLIRLCEVNKNTKATPCFHNDPAVIETLTARGISPEHARDYSIVGCVEPTIGGKTYGHHGSILMNITAALEMAIWGGKHRFTGDEQIGPSTKLAVEMNSFDEFKAALETHLSWLIVHAITLNNQLGRVHQKIHPTPMLSAIMENCMEKGEDVVKGGALYNSSGVAIIGLADVVDSMTAIEEFVFNKKKLTMREMVEAIIANWEGPYKRYHAMVKTSKEKFGTDSPMAAANAEWLIQFLHDRFEERENYRGGRYTVGYWTMTSHAGFGALTEASPSGRMKYEPFASGITPVSGSAPVLTSCLNFVASLDRTKKITNGHALNLKYTPLNTTPIRVADDIEAFFKSGGLQIQFNIIDQETLRKACEDPKHGDFLIRVSGYTAYFKDLNPTMQKEIIDRALYDPTNGRQVNSAEER